MNTQTGTRADSQKERSTPVTELAHDEAREYFLKSENYCSIGLPGYINFNGLIEEVDAILRVKELSEKDKKEASRHDDTNYTIISNKDGRYAWRPVELIHPALYVSLVHAITDEDNWSTICGKFQEFARNNKIRCLSVPVKSNSDQSDKAEQIFKWWEKTELRSIELALDFNYLLESDIADCYGSIYTHSIAWALHGKQYAKEKRSCKKLIGNQIDRHLQAMRNGQTNGIPQGSVLMDFIAEMVLGHSDRLLSLRIKKAGIEDYYILRYRDDCRIYVNDLTVGEEILKLLSTTMMELGFKLNASKTRTSKNVVLASLKPDKVAWQNSRKKRFAVEEHPKYPEYALLKQLYCIHNHGINYPNAGSLMKILQQYLEELERLYLKTEKPKQQKYFENINADILISIAADIAYNSPKTHPICFGILSKLLGLKKDGGDEEKKKLIEKIRSKFGKLPNAAIVDVWLQRLSIKIAPAMKYEESLCGIVAGDESISIWNPSWITYQELREACNPMNIVDRKRLEEIPSVISSTETALFAQKYSS